MRRFMVLGLAVVLLFAGLLPAAPAAFAATKTWVGAASGGQWSVGSNWSPSGAPAANDTVLFSTKVSSTANLGSLVAIGAIVFGSGAGGSVVNGAVTINAAAATFNIDDQSTSGLAVDINATVDITAPSATTLYVKSGTVGRTLYFLQPISGGHAVRIVGPGAVEFAMASNNTYTGATSVAPADFQGGAGLLLLSGFATALVPGDLFIGGGGGAANTVQVRLTAVFSNLIKDTSKVTVASDGKLDMGTLTETIAQLSGTGNVTMSGSNILTVGDAGNFTWGGVISGSGNVNKVGTGAMTYTGPNTYTGITTVSGGTLVLGAPANTKSINGPLSIGLGVGLTTTATVQLANNFQIDSTTLPITINSDGKLDLASFADFVGAVTLNGGNIAVALELRVFGDLSMTGGTITGAGTLDMRSDVVATSTGPLGAATINANVVLGNASVAFTVNSGSAQPELTINGAVTGPFPSTRNLTKTGTGTLRLAGTAANTYGGSTTIERGVLELAKPFRVNAITGPVVIGNGADPAGAAVLKNLEGDQIGGNSTVQINASGKFDLNGFSQTIVSLSGVGTVSLPPGAWVTVMNPAGTTATYNGIISGAGRISKSNEGTQIFTGDNSYTGTTILGGGTLIINGQQTGDAFFDRGGWPEPAGSATRRWSHQATGYVPAYRASGAR